MRNNNDRTLRLIAFIFVVIRTVLWAELVSLMPLILGLGLTMNDVSSATFQAGFAKGILVCLLPFVWLIPITIHTYKIFEGKKKNTVAFGICTLILCSLVGGILLLCSKKDISGKQNNIKNKVLKKDGDLRLVAFIFAVIMIVLGIILFVLNLIAVFIINADAPGSFVVLMSPMLICLMPLAWWIPMAIYIYKIYKGERNNTVAFGVCTLLFLNPVSGILLLCSTKDK